MSRHLAPFAVFGILGCASSPTTRWDIGPLPERETPHALAPSDAPAEAVPSAEVVSTAEAVSTDEAIAADTPVAGSDPDPAELTDAMIQGAYAPPPQQPFSRSRFTLKGGYYSMEDTNRVDDGYIIEGAWLNFFSPHFATELEIGYLEADGKHAGIETDVWGIPFMLNARLSIPVKSIELYGGAGLGSIYYDVSVQPGVDASGWVAAADTFLGATLTLKNSIVLGIEGKYYFTDTAHSLDGGLDAYAAMLTVGFAR